MTSPSRVVDSQRFHEIQTVRQDLLIETVEPDFDGAGLDACLVENILQAHAGPARVAHGAVAPCPPVRVAEKNPREFPEHWLTATRSTAGIARRSRGDRLREVLT